VADLFLSRTLRSIFSVGLDMPDDPSLNDKPTYSVKGHYVPRLSSGRVSFWHTGSLSGTLAIAVRTSAGYAWVALFNGLLMIGER